MYQPSKNVYNPVKIKHLNKKFPLMLSEILQTTKKTLFDSLLKQEEYIGLGHGDLRVELGLVDGQSRLISIMDRWLSTIELKFTPFKRRGSKITGGIKIRGVKNDYSDVLGDYEANFTTEKGENLPWLEWLLLDGSSVIIADYRYREGIGEGRAGGGTMRKGGSWGVPDPYTGVQSDNFITRAIDSMLKELEIKFIQIIESKI